jgi:hypothetical protein
MLPVFDPLQKAQIFPIFPVALIGIPGEAAENTPDHNDIRQGGQHKACPGGKPLQDHRNQAQYKTQTQQRHIQFICAVPAGHKAAHCLSDFLKKTHNIHLCGYFALLYGQFLFFARQWGNNLRFIQIRPGKISLFVFLFLKTCSYFIHIEFTKNSLNFLT